MILFSHDDRMVERVGEAAYVRWMDDQNFGVMTRAEGLGVLNLVGRSLATLHLTPNSGKSQVLSLAEARRNFHLDLNRLLDEAETLPLRTNRERQILRSKIKAILRYSLKFEGQGEWNKILKRIYLRAGVAKSRYLRSRALNDVIAYPDLGGRIADYMRWTGTAGEFISFAQRVWTRSEQIHGFVNLEVTECLIQIEAFGTEKTAMRRLASDLLRGKLKMPGYELCREVAPLILLRFGDRRSLPLLKRLLEQPFDGSFRSIRRSAGVVFASYGLSEYRHLRGVAARLQRRQFAELVHMVERIIAYDQLPKRHLNRFRLRYDASVARRFIDMRDVLAIRLLALNRKPTVLAELRRAKASLMLKPLSNFDRNLLSVLLAF